MNSVNVILIDYDLRTLFHHNFHPKPVQFFTYVTLILAGVLYFIKL